VSSINEYADKREQARTQIQMALDICKERNQKVLVFCNRKITCDILSEIYDAPKYYSDARNKAEALRNWTSGLMLATGALGAGVNVSEILFVFHWDMPTGMIEFDQEVGRGGRGEEVVRSVILLPALQFKRLMRTESRYMEKNQAALKELITRLECRRKTISGFMDGEEHDCKAIDGEVCDRCGGVMSEVERKIRGIDPEVDLNERQLIDEGYNRESQA
jgi:superfamily II DNA helicase RecQ